jgi:hypothetical protein
MSLPEPTSAPNPSTVAPTDTGGDLGSGSSTFSAEEKARAERVKKTSTSRVQALRARRAAEASKTAPPVVLAGPAGPVAPPPPAAVKPPEPPDPRTDAELSRDLGVLFGALLWPLLGILAALPPFRGRLHPLTTEEERDLGHAWLPIARRWPLLARLSSWTGPVQTLRLVRAKFYRPTPPAPKQTPAQASAGQTAPPAKPAEAPAPGSKPAAVLTFPSIPAAATGAAAFYQGSGAPK